MHSIIASSAWAPWDAFGGQWFDGAVATVGSPVSSWAARTPSTATALQATGANQPNAPAAVASLKNQLALGFDGTSDIMVSDTAIDLSAFTFCSVVRLGTLKNYVGLFRLAPTETTGAAGSWAVYSKSDGSIEYGSGSLGWFRSSSSTGLIASNGAYAILVTCDGTSAGTIVQIGTISAGSISWATAAFGAVSGSFAAPSGTNYLQPGGSYNTAGTSRLVGDLALYGAVGRVISASEETTLKGYLRSRFAP
jgi:hypothetical protein